MTGLWFAEQQVLRASAASPVDALHACSYPLVPYSNRVGYRTLHWADQEYVLTENFAPEPHAIHGVGWSHSWSVQAITAHEAVLTCQHVADAAWPFAFDSRQTFRLTHNALELTMSITNRADVAAPAGLGWHPYFAKSAQTRLQFAAAGRWEMGHDKLPTVCVASTGLDTDCAQLDVDHCFDGWSGQLQLVEGSLRITVRSDLDRLVVYTTPQRDSIAIEPVSHVNNALALAHHTGQSAQSLGVRVLQPGETFSASMRIQVENT